ncbi:MAG: hypothetical protein ACHRXM_37130 [Isosphaerales bacterium]
MALTGQEAGQVASQGASAWGFDDAIGELVPLQGTSPSDLTRSIGQPASRFLVNRMVPASTFGWTSAAGTAVTAATETSLLAAAGWKGAAYSGLTAGTFPALFLNRIGKIINFNAWGIVSATASTPTNNFKFKLGSNIVVQTGTQTTASVTGTLPWFYSGWAMVTATGSSGTLLGQGLFTYFTTAPIIVGWAAYQSGAVTADLTTTLAIDLTSTWSAITGSPSITCQGIVVGVSN